MTYRDIYAFDCGTTNWRLYRLACQEQADGIQPLSDPQRVGLTTFSDSHLPAALVLDAHGRLLAYGANAYELAQDGTLGMQLRDAFKLCIGNRQPIDPLHPQRRYTHAEALGYTRLLLDQVIARLAEERPGSLAGDALFFFAHPVHWGQESATGQIEGEILPEFAAAVRGCVPEPLRGNVHFVPEPAAALLSLGQSGQLPPAGDAERLTLLIDMGGGTTDFVAGRWTGAGFEEVRTYGEAMGGGVFDAALADYLADTLQVPADRRLQAGPELRHFGRQLKERLSQQMRMEPTQAISMAVTLKLEGPDGTATFLSRKLRFDRQAFETCTAQQTATFAQMAARALASMNLAAADVTRIVLVGGGANLYLVPLWITSLVGLATPVIYGDPPEDVVARGASLWHLRRRRAVHPAAAGREQGKTLIEQSNRVRQEAIALVDALLAQATASELPKAPDTLARSRERLAENAYTVLVVGEAKRGKSSFINALIGRDLLPTDVDVATSQVFRVQPAETEAYRIRFEDGSQRAITAADLPRYGSQVVADVQGVPRLDQIIRWIEVDIPIKFLPPGVTLLDTPGMGSLYAAHTQITQRFVPYADAVIYVLDSGQPLGQPDLEFIEQLLAVTPNLFFIQTKIDQYRRDDWQKLRQRNEAILAEHFAGRLPSTRVWPISSRNLLKAAQTGDEDYLAVSRQGELSGALQSFLFRVAGWHRAALAAMIAERYFSQSRQTLVGRLAGVTETAPDRPSNMQEQAVQRLRQFEAEWGTRGASRQDLLARIRRISTEARHSFEEVLQPNGPIERSLLAKVSALTSVKQADQAARALPAEIATVVNQYWQQMCRFCETETASTIEPFASAAEAVTVPEIESLPPNFSAGTGPRISRSLWAKLAESVKTSWESSNSLLVRAAEWWDESVGLLVRAGATVWGLFRGWSRAEQKQLQKAREELWTYLEQEMQHVRAHFLSVDLRTGQHGLVDQYLDRLTQNVTHSIETVVAQKQREAQAEVDRLAAQTQLDGRARQAQLAQAQRDLAAWDQLGQRLAVLTDELEALDRATAVPA